MTVEYDIKLANNVLDYIAKVMPYGWANAVYFWQQSDAKAKLYANYERVDLGLNYEGVLGSALDRTRGLNAGAGYCVEMAGVAYCKLKTMGVPKLALMAITDLKYSYHPFGNRHVHLKPGEERSHAFVVISGKGIVLGARSNCYDWGDEAVICDPWIPLADYFSDAAEDWPNYSSTSIAIEVLDLPNKYKRNSAFL